MTHIRTAQDLPATTWRKSSYSDGSGGNCVEVTHLDTQQVAIRDSKDPDGPVLVIAAAEFAAFLDGLSGW